MKKLRKGSLLSTTIYNKQIASDFHDIRFYEYEQDRIRKPRA
jgi:hypothetical protein